MITIIRGPRAALRRHPAIARPPGGAWTFRREGDPSLPLPWAGARQLLALLRARLGHAAVEQAIVPQRATLSLILRGPGQEQHQGLVRAG